jgi:hypothetical protein
LVGVVGGVFEESYAYTHTQGLNLMHKVGIEGQGPQHSQKVSICFIDVMVKRPPDFESKYLKGVSDFYYSNFTPAANAWFRQIQGRVIHPTISLHRGSMSFTYDLKGKGLTPNTVPLLTGCASPSSNRPIYDAAVFLDWDDVSKLGTSTTGVSKTLVGANSGMVEPTGLNITNGIIIFKGEQLAQNGKAEHTRALYHELGHLIAGLGDTYVENCGLAVKLYQASDGLLYPHPPAIMNWQSGIQLDDNLGAWATWLRGLPVGTMTWDWLNERVPELVAKMGLFKGKNGWEQDPARNLIAIWNLTGRLVDPACK